MDHHSWFEAQRSFRATVATPRRVVCLPQWMCPPKGVQRRTGTRRRQDFFTLTPSLSPRGRGGFTLTSAFAKASAVALRAMADKTADRPSLSRSTQRLSTGHRGRGGYETACKPYGSAGSIADEFGRCKGILAFNAAPKGSNNDKDPEGPLLTWGGRGGPRQGP